ncbi:unnamed protein product [Rotaria sp. Silwood1]|nr:unnamed protein product [Rotaria sp. Silwood1]
MPSVFGINNLKFTIKNDIMIENECDYINVIKREIDDRLVGKSSGKRAILVFFESNRKLKEFYDSTALGSLKELTVYLTEEASLDEKEILIKRATTSDQITLFTRTFGRGTDFKCDDQIIATNGGTHVIQTFLSEEVQIKGRTARQGDHRSYSMILLDRDLEKFHTEKVDIEDVKKEGFYISRTVCLMDATGSMYYLLHKCKNTVDIMFERASEILKEQNIKSDSFQLQFVVYRNYNSREDKILQSSPWETKPDNLRAFMNTIEVEGGWNNEAIEIGLWHANEENERENITQVILIVAEQTGGRCEMLDINSSSGSQMLTDLITEEILRNVGGSTKGNALVEAYRKIFHKDYT